VKVDVSYQFQQIGIFLAQDRLVALLKKMAATPVTPVVRNSVSGQQTTHHRGDGDPPRPQQQMK